MMDYTLLTDEELQDLFDGQTSLWICRAEHNNKIYNDLLRGLSCEQNLSNSLAVINMEMYRRRNAKTLTGKS